jgi:hypothetical protein
VTLPPDLLERAGVLVTSLDPVVTAAGGGAVEPMAGGGAAPVRRLDATGWPAGLVASGRHGFAVTDRAPLRAAMTALAAEVAPGLPTTGRVLVLGTEELMYAPLLLAIALDQTRDQVRYSSTTRSPVLPVDERGYAIRTRLEFAAHDGTGGRRYVHNVAGARFAAIVLVVDATGDTARLWAADGLVEVLRQHTGQLTVVVVPDHRPARVAA